MAEGVTWVCPACFAPLEAVGPATLQLEIASHIRAHERAARRATLAECGNDCAKMMATDKFCAARKPNPQGLTPFDVNFLESLKVAWDPPVRAEDLK